MFDLTAMSTLRAVAEHGTVIAAADATGYTPSAVSQQIKRLERGLGLPLLERVGRGVILTEHGRRLCDSGGELFALVERIESRMQAEAREVRGTVRLTCFSTAMRGMIAPVARRLVDQHPDLTLRLTEAEPWQAVDMVAAGQVDVAVAHSWGTVPLAVPDHVRSTVVRHDIADLIVPVGHPLAGRTRVRVRDLLAERWIATPNGTICREFLEHMYAAHGSRPAVIHESAEFDAHLALVDAGLGVALVPRMGRGALPDGVRVVRVIDPTPTREVMAMHRASMEHSPAVRAVMEAMAASGG